MSQELEQHQNTLQITLKELADIKFALDTSSIVAITDHKGKITYANDKFCEISKYSRNELIGQDHRIINSSYHPKEFMRGLWQTIMAGKVWRGEIRNKAKDDTFYWVDTTIVPFLNDQGRPYQYISIRNDITKRKMMEEQVKALPQRIIQAHEEEREYISREIHDDLGQSLATLKILIQSTLLQSIQHTPVSKSAGDKTIKYLDNIIEKTRHLAAGLRPATLEVLGFSSSLKSLVDEFKKNYGLDIQLKHGPLNNLEFKTEAINLYRVIQEALANITKHAKATKIEIDIHRKKNRLILKISDNGKGFDHLKYQNNKGVLRQGLGLSTMQERAKLLDAEFAFHSCEGKGTVITLDIPVTLKEEING